MQSVKSIVAGSLFIIIAILFVQLAYIFIAVGYSSLAKDYTFLNDISSVFRYLIGVPVVMSVMFIGGYITAEIARVNVLRHDLAVGIITAGGMMLMALQNTQLTLLGVFVLALALGTVVAGGMYWKKDNKTDD